MVDTTALGIPFPEDTDNFSDLVAHIEGVAEGVDALLTELFGAWSTYTPAIVGSTSGGALGNGTHSCRYVHAGRLVVVMGSITLGTTTSLGVGTATISLPPVAARAVDPAHFGDGFVLDASPSARRGVACELDTTGRFIMAQPDTGALVNATSPWTWTTGDIIRFRGAYEAAAAP